MRRLYCMTILAVLLIGLLPIRPAAAQEKSVVMPIRTGEITIRPDGKIDVCETWTVQFIGGSFKYARRTIPFNKVETIENWRIREDGQSYRSNQSGAPNTYQVSQENGQQIAIWYFPPTTDQERTFEVCYTLVGALRIEETQDEFYWKFIEPDRSYPVEKVQVKLYLPKSFDPDEIEATTYRNGKDAAGGEVLDGATVAFTSGRIEPQQEWEIRVRFPHGAIKAQPPAWQVGENQAGVKPAGSSWLFGLGLAAGYILVISILVVRRRVNRRAEVADLMDKPIDELPGVTKIIMKPLVGVLVFILGPVLWVGGPALASSQGLGWQFIVPAAGLGLLCFIGGAISFGGGAGSNDGDSWGGGGDFGGGGGGGSDFG